MSIFRIKKNPEPTTPLDVLAPDAPSPTSPVHVPQGYEIKIEPHNGSVFKYYWRLSFKGEQIDNQWCHDEAQGLREAQKVIKNHQATQEHLSQPTKRFVGDRIIEE